MGWSAALVAAPARVVRLPEGRPVILVESALEHGGRCSTANRSEAAQNVMAAGGDWDLNGGLLDSSGLTFEPVDADDAHWAAQRWRRGEGLCLGDRLCLALAHRLGEDALTADSTWGERDGISLIR